MNRHAINTVVTSKVISVPQETPLTEVISLMGQKNISCLVIVENNRPVGIFTERDLVFLASLGSSPKNFTVKEVMSTSVITAPEELDLFDAYQLLETNKIRHLVLVDCNSEVAGVITQTDIVNQLGLEYFIELKNIEKIMSRDVVTISKGYPLSDVVLRMAEHAISCIVVEEERIAIGILTERDIVRLFRRGEDLSNLIVEEVMSRPVTTVSPSITVHEAANLMNRKKIRRMVVTDPDGRIAGLITQHDIVKNFELKYIEFLKKIIHEKDKALLETKKLLNEKIVLDNILRYSTEMAIVATDLGCGIVYYNPAAEKIFGHKADEIIGRNVIGVFAEGDVATFPFDEAKRVVHTGEGYKFEFERKEKGSTLFIDSTITGIWDGSHKLVGYVLMARDITKRRMAEEEILRRSNIQAVLNSILSLSLANIEIDEVLERSLNLILSIPWLAFESTGGIFLTEENQNALVLKVQKELSPAIRKACARVPFGVCLCGRAAAEKKLVFANCIDNRHEIRYAGIAPHGHYNVPILFGDRLLGVICIYVKEGHLRNRNEEDFLTAVANTLSGVIVRKQMEAQIVLAKKIESVGILAGGIAHDFNNLMTGVLGNISLAKTLARPDEDIYKLLSSAEKASLRTKDLTQQLLTFSRGGQPVKKIIDIPVLIEEITTFSLRDSALKCDFEFTDNLWPVEADPGQLRQVIQNLIFNAKESMPAGGSIRIKAQNIKLADTPEIPAGDYTKISVEDQGVGIPQDYLQKVFDPYFTTKAMDSRKGTGLGLAVAYSIIKEHNGYIFLTSKEGIGTNFYIYLPASPKHIAENNGEGDRRPLPGRGKILLMDDEEVVSNVASEMLESIGYEVEVADNGISAIKLYQKAKASGSAFDAVILDLTIKGGMGAKETLKKMRDIEPNVIAVVSSGFSNNPAMSEFKELGFKAVLTKPYTLQKISEVLHEILKNQVAT